MTPAWPVEATDPQFDPRTTCPIEMSEKDNGTNISTPTYGITEETATAPAAALDTNPAYDTAVSMDTAPLTAPEQEEHREEFQEDAQAAQNDARENAPAEPSHEVTEADHTVDPTLDEHGIVPVVASDADDAQNTAEDVPDAVDGKVEDSEVTKEIARQPSPKTAQESKQEWLSLFQVLTDDGPAEVKNLALTQFNTRLDQLKGSMLGKSQDVKAGIVSSAFGTIYPLMMKADAFRCLCSIMIGELANNLKKDIQHGNWTETSRKFFPNIEARELQHAMRLANVRKAALYCNVGKTKLIQLAIIASKAPFSSADDPIGMVLGQVQGQPHLISEEYEMRAKAAIADNNLKKQELFIDPYVLQELYDYGEEITNNDVAEMLAWKKRHDEDNTAQTPTDFLRAALKNDGKRVFELTAPKEKSRKGKGKSPTIPNINSMFEKTRETIQLALNNFDPEKLKVDQELYQTLMATLKNFGEAVFQS